MSAATFFLTYSVAPSAPNPRDEIFLPWNPEFQSWHDYWFGSTMQYHAYMDQMSLLEYFLSGKNTWAIAPFSVAQPISKQPYVSIHHLESPPSDRIIYCIKKANREIQHEQTFLRVLKETLDTFPALSPLLDIK